MQRKYLEKERLSVVLYNHVEQTCKEQQGHTAEWRSQGLWPCVRGAEQQTKVLGAWLSFFVLGQ